jgi:hypothetical protein
MLRTWRPYWVFVVLVAFLAIDVIADLFVRITYRADSRGLTVSFLSGRKFIDWREVASYMVTPGSGSKAGRVLTDPSGRVLLKLPFYERANPDAENFMAYLDARLAPVRQHDLPVLTR